jgi:hypothetical protein
VNSEEPKTDWKTILAISLLQQQEKQKQKFWADYDWGMLNAEEGLSIFIMPKVEPNVTFTSTSLDTILKELISTGTQDGDNKQLYKGLNRYTLFDEVAVPAMNVLKTLHANDANHGNFNPKNVRFVVFTGSNTLTARIDFEFNKTVIISDPKSNSKNQNDDKKFVPLEVTGSYSSLEFFDKYALGMTLRIILGHCDEDNPESDRIEFCNLLMTNEKWENILKLGEIIRNKKQGGAKRKAQRAEAPRHKAPPKWVSTGLKASIKRPRSASSGPASSLKTIFKNSVTGELRVRKATVSKDGSRKFSYVKFTRF